MLDAVSGKQSSGEIDATIKPVTSRWPNQCSAEMVFLYTIYWSNSRPHEWTNAPHLCLCTHLSLHARRLYQIPTQPIYCLFLFSRYRRQEYDKPVPVEPRQLYCLCSFPGATGEKDAHAPFQCSWFSDILNLHFLTPPLFIPSFLQNFRNVSPSQSKMFFKSPP